MEPRPLTTWEQKERDGLLALETDEWREKRLIAEDPNTTADTLQKFSKLINAAWLKANWQSGEMYATSRRVGLLTEAIAAHPNTPPVILVNSLGGDMTSLDFPAFCRNPITPLLGLELPDFWQQLALRGNEEKCQKLLREINLPLIAVRAFTSHYREEIAHAAHLHISIAGEVQTEAEGIEGVCASDCADYQKDYHIDLYNFPKQDMSFLRTKGYAHHLRMKGTSSEWTERVYAVFQLPLTAEPFYVVEECAVDWNRSPLDLLNHLARDGNRFVRWAAQTRLTDPDFVFTWDEGN